MGVISYAMPLQNQPALRFLLLVLLALAAMVAVMAAAPRPVSAQGDEPTLVIDVGPQGNEGTVLGPIEDCVRAEVGDVFSVDMVIRDVTDLLAWEASLEYDPQVVIVVGQDTTLFQEADGLSAVIDISQPTPDDSGFHTMSAFDSSDPVQPDSGSGVLARVTLEAVGEGESELNWGELDIDEDGVIDRGVLLRDIDAEVIGDEDGDGLFDGEREGAFVAVGQDCPPGTTVVEAEAVGNVGADDGGNNAWLLIAGGGVIAAVVALGAGFVLMRRGRKPPTGSPAAS